MLKCDVAAVAGDCDAATASAGVALARGAILGARLVLEGGNGGQNRVQRGPVHEAPGPRLISLPPPRIAEDSILALAD